MAPRITLHLIRHAQGYHNLSTANHTLTDPSLTPYGESQCLTLRNNSFPPAVQSRISLIAASPLTRTLHTAYLTFQPLLDASHTDHAAASEGRKLQVPEIIALPDAQETSDFPCDTGTAPAVLSESVRTQGWPVDLSRLYPSWTDKALSSRYSPHSDAIKARAKDTRVWLRGKALELVAAAEKAGNANEDVELVLVTHGGYLHYFTGDWEDASTGLGTGWVNCETRSYHFESDLATSATEDVDAEAKIIETQTSRARRGKITSQPTWAEQEELFELTMQKWEESGLQRPDRIGEGWEWKSGLVAAKDESHAVRDGEKGEEGVPGPGQRQAESAVTMQQEFDLPVKGMDEIARERSGSVTVKAQA